MKCAAPVGSGNAFGLLLLDHALKRLAQVMREHSRVTDIAARYGGNEFGILLIDADYERSEQAAARIRNCLSLETVIPRLTVSIGVAVYPEDGLSAQDLLEIADRRLYQDKKSAAALLQAATAE